MIDSDTRWFTGVVTSSDAATFAVQINPYGDNQVGCIQGIPLASVFTSTIGFKEHVQYPIGAMVLCYSINGDLCYVMGIIPEHDFTAGGWFSRACLSTADGNFDKQNVLGYGGDVTKQVTHNQGRATDIVEGEYVLANEFGVLLGLFQNMASLKGSELSQIQCYLLDDLVRVVSHNYQHFHAMGNFTITHDGKALMAEFGSTHLPQEAMGQPQVESANNAPTFAAEDGGAPSTIDDSKDYYKFTKDTTQVAIERLKGFVGRLGDLVNLFIVRPDPTTIRTLSGALQGKYDKGMANVHISLDGRIEARSITGVAIEKTNWIRVPHRVYSPEDPEGDHEDDIEFSAKDPFKFDDSVTYRGNPSLYFLQMRDCNAYLQDLYNYKNFLEYEKDFKLANDSQDNETDIGDIDKVDPNTAVNLSNYQLRRSGLYLMDNGGVMIKDAWGSATVWEGGNIYHQPAKDYIVQPMRNYIAKVGQFTSIASKKDIDLSSTDSGFRLKTKQTQHFYSDTQGIILQSNSNNDEPPSPDDEAYTDMGGILLKSNKGIYSYGDRIFDRAVTSSLYKSGAVTIESTKQSTEFFGTGLLFATSGSIEMFSQAGIDIVAQGSAVFAGSSTALGNKGVVVGLVPHPGSPFPCIMDGTVPVSDFADATSQLLAIVPQEEMAPFDTDAPFTNLKFRFLKSDVYGLQDGDNIPMTIAQQDDQAFSFLNLSTWTETTINNTLPFPGQDKFMQYYVTCNLQNLQKIDGDIYSKASDSLTSDGTTLTPQQSLQNYKILGN